MSLICFIYSLNKMIPSLKTTVNSFQVMLGGYDLYQLSGMEQFLTLECIIQVHSEILIIYCSIPVPPLYHLYANILYGRCVFLFFMVTLENSFDKIAMDLKVQEFYIRHNIYIFGVQKLL